MANNEQVAILKKGPKAWNMWRKDNPDTAIDLSEVGLSADQIRNVNLSGVNLKRSGVMGAPPGTLWLVNADLRNSNLSYSDLGNPGASDPQSDLSPNRTVCFQKADFSGSILDCTSLQNADLSGANLSDTILFRTNFHGADLSNTNFSGAKFNDVVLTRVNLTGAIGLEACRHSGPSSLDMQTLAMSKGLPESFLRGCGLADWLIEAYKLMQPHLGNEEIIDIAYHLSNKRIGQVVQINPVFISYSHCDSKFVDKVGDELDKRGIRYWRDIHDAPAGRLEKTVDQAIRHNPLFLLVLSRHSVNSDWVEHEVRLARQLEKELARDVICPISLDDSWKNSKWPARLREQLEEYYILNFSAWTESADFNRMFERLLHGMFINYDQV